MRVVVWAREAMRILLVTNEGRGRYAGRRFEWLGMDFTYSSFTFEALVRFRDAPDARPVIHRQALERALEELEAFDGVVAEEPETVLLEYVRRRRGLARKRWLVNTVQLFRRAGPLRELIRAHYGEDPLAVVAADPSLHWIVTTSAHREQLTALGVPDERSSYIPTTSAIQTGFFPDSTPAFVAGRRAALPQTLESLRGQVLLAGTNHRDLPTLARAAALLPAPVHVLTDLERNQRVESPHLRYHGLVPLDTFIGAVAHAGVLVLPLLPTTESCGQQTLAAAQRVGTLVVASDVPALRDYIEDGRSGFLVRPDDAEALALGIERALAHRDDESIIAAGRARDERDAQRIIELMHRVFASDGGRLESARASG